MKVFLGNAPWREGSSVGVRAGSRWPHFQPIGRDGIRPDYLPFPFFLAYAAAVLEQNNISVMLRDATANGENVDSFIECAKRFSPDIVLLETSTPTINIDTRIAEAMRRVIPSAVFAFSGPHAPMFETSFLYENKVIDLILYGEYELTLLELVQKLKNKEELDDVDGLIFRKAGVVQKNPPRPLIENLDSLPFPARHLLPMMHYNDSVCNLPRPNLQMWASRGCPYQCNFCAWPQIMYGGSKYRTRNPAIVAEEMDIAVKKYGFKGVYFDDDTFNLQKDRVLNLCEEICKRDLNKRVSWAVMARADAMDDELLLAFKKSGLYAVKYGVETGSQKLIDEMGKKLSLEEVERVVRKTKELGIRVHLTFSFGHPGETRETVNKTIETAILLEPDAVQFSIITPFPGSRYHETLKREGKLEVSSWENFNGSHKAVFHTDNLSAKDLQDAKDRAYSRWEIESEQKNNRMLREKLSIWVKENSFKGNLFVIRSSFLTHTKSVLKTFAKLLPNIQIDMLVQDGVANDIKKWDILSNIYIYKGEEFKVEGLDDEVIKQVSESDPLVLILYNNPDGTGYENVHKLARRLCSSKIIAVNPRGDVLTLKKELSWHA